MACSKIESDCIRLDERKQKGFDLAYFCARLWRPKTFYNAGDTIRVLGTDADGEQVFTGFDYEATEDGYTGEAEPAWPEDLTETVTDGSLQWETVEVSNASLVREIQTVVWIPDAGMTVEDETEITTDGRQQIAAFHEVTTATTSQKPLTVARVTYTDTEKRDYGIKWTIQE